MKIKGCFQKRGVGVGLLVLGLVFLGTGLYLSNQRLPTVSPRVDALGEDDLAHVAESKHLRTALGATIWPGFDTAPIPILLYNEENVYLTGVSNPERGWARVPSNGKYGTQWKRGAGYDWQPLPENGETPQAFIVQLESADGILYAASMTTYAWTKIELVNMIRVQLPEPARAIFPFQLFINQFDRAWYQSALLHESFHVLQMQEVPARLFAAQDSYIIEQSYAWEEQRDAWAEERRVLAEALKTNDPAQMRKLAQEFIRLRHARRASIPDTWVHFEQSVEWLEGLAKYVELASYRAAAQDSMYAPVPAMADLADFNHYAGFERRWRQERNQLRTTGSYDAVLFYYTGWAQAEMLDVLRPGWKEEVFGEGVYLDDLIARAISE